MKTIQNHLDTFRPVIAYEQNLGRTSLTSLRIIFFVIFISCLTTILIAEEATGEYAPALLGCALIFFALWVEQVLLYCYHNSFYFRGFDSLIGSAGKEAPGISYEVAQIMLANEADITSAFITSALGLEIMVRSGVSSEACISFIQSNRTFLTAGDIRLEPKRTTDVYDLGQYIYMYDLDFKLWLDTNAVTRDTFIGALQFVIKNYTREKRKKRWWSRDRLSLHTGLGRGLSTGVPYELERFSQRLSAQDIVIDQNTSAVSHLKVTQQIEQALAKNRAANILLIGEAVTSALDILASVETRTGKGSAINALAGLHFSVFDYEQLLATFTEKYELEDELARIFNQAAISGTQVIIIPNISHFIHEASLCQVDIPQLLETYLSLPTLHFIGIDTPQNFHQSLRPLQAFTRRFEEILLEPTTVLDTVAVLEPIALRQEKRRGVLFTYDAITGVAENAERYLTTGVMPERAIDLIHEVAQTAAKQGVVIIGNTFVDAVVAEKTGMPVGPISKTEQDRLLHLEQILHERVIGQNAAISAIARTMRRARVGIERADKPIGSFLFLGPTGVGKTETAKALAYTFFGEEANMIRFDMSEFSGDHTLAHFIGEEGGTGSLTDKLHEHPYSVILLDEFEKAAESIHDLFLQILDEGYFTSATGSKVNARNTIIIATSNAGSDLIRKTTTIRNTLPNLDADIITHVIDTRIFKPELINRFDNTIIFEPLQKTEQSGVAKLQLTELTKRVLDQGYQLSVAPALLDTLVDIGYNPNSGGRGIMRVLQDILEEKIAQKVISGAVKKGGYLHLDLTDFTPEELSL
jgi:ATP-dependent Clp protease ATP-binding subunit ClpC